MMAAHSVPNNGCVVACSRCDSGLGFQHMREDGVRHTIRATLWRRVQFMRQLSCPVLVTANQE